MRFSGAATTAAVTFYKPDGVTAWPEASGSTNYRVEWTEYTIIAGGPTIVMPNATSKLNTGFTANVPTAPGVGNTVDWRYRLVRDN